MTLGRILLAWVAASFLLGPLVGHWLRRMDQEADQ